MWPAILSPEGKLQMAGEYLCKYTIVLKIVLFKGPRWLASRPAHMPASITATLLSKDAAAATSLLPPDEHLLHAAVRGDVSGTLRLLRAGANPNGYRDRYGTAPLHAASRSGSVRVCTALIEARADVNAADSVGGTPLSQAVRKVYPQIVRLLIEHGAQLNVWDRWGRLPAEELLCGGPSTTAEHEIRAYLLGRGDATWADKAEHLRRTRVAEQARENALRMHRAATAAVEAERAAGMAAEAQAHWEREVEHRWQARPYAWMANTPMNVPNQEGSRGESRADSTGVDRVRRERCEELLRLQRQQAVGYRLAGTPAVPSTIRATSSGSTVVVSSHDRVEAAGLAAWRATFNPLLGGARPECGLPTGRARWNAKEACWEEPLLPAPRGPMGATTPGAAPEDGGPGRAETRSLSGFERLVLEEEA